MTDKQLARTAERLVRLAYDLETIAARLRNAGKQSQGNGVQAAASQLGNIGRSMRP